MKRTETAAFHYRCTICPRSLDPFDIITYYRKWVKTSRTFRRSQSVRTMVLILDGNSEIGAYVRSQSRLYDLLKASDKIENSHKSNIFFLHGCATCSELCTIYYGTPFQLIPERSESDWIYIINQYFFFAIFLSKAFSLYLLLSSRLCITLYFSIQCIYLCSA